MADSIIQLFLETVARRGGNPAARFKGKDGQWVSRTWREMSEDRKVVAAALLSLGVQPHDRVNILANTSYKWMLSDLAVQTCAGEPVAIYQSNLPDECEYIINDCGAVYVIAEDKTQLDKLLKVKSKIGKVKKVIVMNDETDGTDWTIGWSALERLGKEKLKEVEGELDRRVGVLKPNDVLTIIYTSGTTGMPKGVVLTHSNMIYEYSAVREIDLIRDDDLQLLFLPMAHSFAKVLQCVWFGGGHEMAIDYDLQQIVPNLAVVRPTVMCAVPRVFEKVYARVTGQGLEAPGLKGKLFKWALETSDKVAQLKQENKPVPSGLQIQLNIAKTLVFSKVNARLTDLFGGRLRYFVSGGAPLSKRMAFFFDNAGINILEGYGLTETSAATCVNRPQKNKIGTVGPALPGTTLKIAQDGEILIKGPGVMREYWGKPEATKETISPDGWFSTGDIGEIDADGYLKITDRKKDIIVTAGGKNVAPQNIESMLKAANPLISQAMVYGDKRKYLVALITVEAENAKKVASAAGVNGDYTAIAKSEPVRKAVEQVVATVNSQIPSYETIKKFQVLDKDFEVGDELTPTLKVKRKHASNKFKAVLDSMYEGEFVD